MAGAGYRGDLGTADNRRSEAIGVAARHDAILLAPDKEGRRSNQRQTLVEFRVAKRPAGACRGLASARLLDRPFGRIRAFRLGLELVPPLGVSAEESGDVRRPL